MRRTFQHVAMIPITIGNERNPDADQDSWVFFNSLIPEHKGGSGADRVIRIYVIAVIDDPVQGEAVTV